MTDCDNEKIFNELYADDLSDYPSDLEINFIDSEGESLSEDSYESAIKLAKRQKINVLIIKSYRKGMLKISLQIICYK